MEFVGAVLVFALVFFLLMRWGCGARMVHGLHRPTKGQLDIVERDPVCGMRIAPGDGLLAERAGRIIRFCSDDCLRRFERHPEMYPAGAGLAPGPKGEER